MDQGKGSDFVVVDKRGQVDISGEEPASAAPPAETGGLPNDAPPFPEMGEINFITFLLSLYSSAMAAFGMLPTPDDGRKEENIEGGKEMIDILGLLKEKTKGNLNAEEDTLLNNVLYELRMVYLEKQRVRLL
jgi:hypothetical protein